MHSIDPHATSDHDHVAPRGARIARHMRGAGTASRIHRAGWHLACVGVLFAVACAGDEPPTEGDTGSETKRDAVAGHVPDAGAGRVPDAPAKPGAFCEIDGQIVIDAEHASEIVAFDELELEDASGGLAMRAGEGMEAALRYDVEFAQGGDYHVWLRTQTVTVEDDGLFMELDAEMVTAPAGHPFAPTPSVYLVTSLSDWVWEPEWQGYLPGQHEGPVVISVTAGAHRFGILKRKIERPAVDKIVFSTSGAPPTGRGPDETPCD